MAMGNLARNPRDSKKKNQWTSLSRNVCLRMVSCRCTSCMCGPLDNSTSDIYSEHSAKHMIETHPTFLVKNHLSRGYFVRMFRRAGLRIFFSACLFTEQSYCRVFLHLSVFLFPRAFWCLRVPWDMWFPVLENIGTECRPLILVCVCILEVILKYPEHIWIIITGDSSIFRILFVFPDDFFHRVLLRARPRNFFFRVNPRIYTRER